MSDNRDIAIQNLIDAYIEKADVSKVLLAATEMRGASLNEDELTRLVKRLMSLEKYDDAINFIEDAHAPREVCDILAQATWPDTHRTHDLPYERILTLDLSAHIKEVFIVRCKSRGIFIKKELYTFYRDLTNSDRDELVMINLQGTKRDLVRAANIAFAGVSPNTLKKVFYACMESDIEFDYTLRLAKAMKSRATAQYMIAWSVMHGHYINASRASHELRRGKRLTLEEFDECLENALEAENVLEFAADFDDQLANARAEQRQRIFSRLAATHEPLCLKIIKEHADPDFTENSFRSSVTHWSNQCEYAKAYEVAKRSTDEIIPRDILLIILRHIFSFDKEVKGGVNWEEHLDENLADVAYQIFTENRTSIERPHGTWLAALMHFALLAGNLQKALEFAVWRDKPLTAKELELLCAAQDRR